MAFTSTTSASKATSATNKAKGFINIYLPMADGSRGKLGAIAINNNTKREENMLAWLQADPANVMKLLPRLELVFTAVNEESSFALPE